MTAKVSVVIPAHNAAAFIGGTLESVLSQTFSDLEVVVVDDGSADGTRQVVAGAGPPVVLHAGPRRGVSAARNEGVRHSRGDYIAFMDHDDLWEKDKVRRQVELLDADPAVGLVFTQAREMRAAGAPSGAPAEEVFPVIEDPASFLGRAYENLAHWNYIPMSSVMVRRSALPGLDEGAGPFDPRYLLAEDWDLWLRIAADHRIAFIPEPLTRYVIRPGRATERMADLRLEDIEIFERELRSCPTLRASDPGRCRDTLRRLNDEAAYWLLREGRRAEARRCLRRAWRLMPLSIKPLAKIVASALAAGTASRRS